MPWKFKGQTVQPATQLIRSDEARKRLRAKYEESQPTPVKKELTTVR